MLITVIDVYTMGLCFYFACVSLRACLIVMLIVGLCGIMGHDFFYSLRRYHQIGSQLHVRAG